MNDTVDVALAEIMVIIDRVFADKSCSQAQTKAALEVILEGIEGQIEEYIDALE